MIPVLLLVGMLGAPLSIREVDILTLTDTSFSLTWTTSTPAPSQVIYGLRPTELNLSVQAEGEPTCFHFLTVTGLSPGETYYFRLVAGSSLWPPPPLPPRPITTLVPPSGRHLFSFAVMNDIHVGEDISGLIVLPVSWLPPLTPGFTWRNPTDNPWNFTLRAAVRALNQSAPAFTIVNGDLTSWFTLEEFQTAKSQLDLLPGPYYVTRGNHDRLENNPQDYFLSVFELSRSWQSFDYHGFHFILLDDNHLSDGWHDFPEEQFTWLEDDLNRHASKVTFIFSHRPVGARWVDVRPDFRRRLLEIFSRHPQIAAVFNAHSHRAKVSTVPGLTGRLPYIEVPSVKEYPIGFGLVRVYEEGFMYNFIFADCPDCREWNHLTRGQYFGLAPLLLRGRLSDRGGVYLFRLEQ